MIHSSGKRRSFAAVALALTSILLGAMPVAAANPATADRVGGIDTVLAVRSADDFPVASLMRASCRSCMTTPWKIEAAILSARPPPARAASTLRGTDDPAE